MSVMTLCVFMLFLLFVSHEMIFLRGWLPFFSKPGAF